MISWMTTTFSQLGVVLLAELNGDSLIYLSLGEQTPQPLSTFVRRHYPACQIAQAQTPLLTAAVSQIQQYLDKERQVFDLPLTLAGTEFQRRVWSALADIPCGQTATYGEIGARIGAPKAMRAVGQACGANPVPIIIPCHRILAKSALGGYSGGIWYKRVLLEHEGILL